MLIAETNKQLNHFSLKRITFLNYNRYEMTPISDLRPYKQCMEDSGNDKYT